MFYRGNRLPHWHPPGRALFVTVRLAGSLPQPVVASLLHEYHLALAAAQAAGETYEQTPQQMQMQAAQRRCFASLEAHLDAGQFGPTWLREANVQQVVLGALLFYQEQQRFELAAACLMPNHAHIVLVLPAADDAVGFRDTWQAFKRYTARQANQLLGRSGAFWENESFDHVIRKTDDGVGRVVRYVAANPVKAGLCTHWSAWSGTWLAPEWRAALSAEWPG